MMFASVLTAEGVFEPVPLRAGGSKGRSPLTRSGARCLRASDEGKPGVMKRSADRDGSWALKEPSHQRVDTALHHALDARPGGLADGIASRNSNRHPVSAAVVIAVLGYVVVGTVLVGLGLLLTHVLLSGGLGRWDEGVNEWFVTRRTTSLNTITSVATMLGSTAPVIGMMLISVIFLVFRRLWREVGVIVVALAVEFLVFLTTAVIVDRPRPTVPRLDIAPPTSSFPSGHTAAAIALWVSLAIVISMHVRSAFVRTIVWIVALGLPVFVGVSRIYRGMHHPTDVMASVVLGTGAILIALLAIRAASGVADIRHEAPTVDLSAEPARVEVAS